MTKISKAIGKGKESIKGPEYNVELGSDLDDAVERFGKDVVFANYLRNAVIAARSVISALETSGKSTEEIQVDMNTWKPGSTRRTPKSSKESMLSEFMSMDKEAQAAFMKDLVTRAAGEEE